MPRNSLYSNSPYSSRMGGGWIYSDGELYHYGRPGMKWYKTIFGGFDNPKSLTYDPNRGKRENIRNIASNAWENVKGFAGNAAKNFNRYYGAEAKQRMTIKGAHNYNNADWYDYKKKNPGELKGSKGGSITTTSHLEEYMAKQIRDGNAVADDLLNNPSILNKLNMVLQNTQFRVAYNVNNMLKKMGLDDEVDDLISKFTGEESAYGRARRLQDQGSKRNNTFKSTELNSAKSVDKSKAYDSGKLHGNTNKYAGFNRLEGKARDRVLGDMANDYATALVNLGDDGADAWLAKTAKTINVSEEELYNMLTKRALDATVRYTTSPNNIGKQNVGASLDIPYSNDFIGYLENDEDIIKKH